MNLFTYKNVTTGRIFALLATVSMILSTAPVLFLIAEASGSTVLVGPTDVTVSSPSGAYNYGPVDASGYQNLTLSFDFDATALDANPTPDSFQYGWSDGLSDTDLGSFLGLAGSNGAEIGHISVPLPVASQIATLQIYVRVSANGTAPSDQVEITNLTLTGDVVTTCSPQYDVAGPTLIQNSTTGEYFNSIQDAIDDCDTLDNNTIVLTGDVTLSQQVTVTKGITLKGGGYTVSSNFAKTDNSNNSAFGIHADNVTIQNLTIDGSGGADLHGITTYKATNIFLDDVTIVDANRSGLVVNGSSVTVQNITTGGSGWHAINVDQGSGVTEPSVLTVNGVSTHGEVSPVPHIFVDDRNKDVTVNDVNNQYAITAFGDADIYFLKSPEPEICTVEIVSDGSDFVIEKGDTAKELSFIHNAWTAVINGASWIWGDDPVSDPTVDETQTFVKNFGFIGNVLSATLEVASDNTNTVDFNGTNVATVTDSQNFTLAQQDSYDVTSLIQQGGNQLKISVTNDGVPGSNPTGNPAGLLYKLTIKGTETDVEGCVLPYKEPFYVIDGYKWSDENGDGQWNDTNEHGLEDWKIALRPMTMEPVEELFVSAESSDITTSAVTLTSGRTYVVEVSGTYSFGNRPDFVADAEWTHRNDAFTDSPLAAHGWTLGENTYPTVYPAVALDLQIDGQNIDWGAFNEGHLYKTIVEGDGTPLDFSIYDSYYGDNTGGLDVAIYDVTDYVAYTNSDGYYSFEVLPGEYQIVEEMVDGWVQTYPAGPSYYHVSAGDLVDGGYNFGNQNTDVPVEDPSLVITGPTTDGEVLSGTYEFTAEYIDDDDTVDSILWAIREGTCSANTNTVAGNVDGFNNAWSFVGTDFSTTLDMSTWDNGDYCLVVNPSEQPGEDNLRETRWFVLENETPLECVAGVNLLENPSFEEPVVTATRLWDNLAPVSWKVHATANNAPVGMELQRGVFGWLPSNGAQMTELDTNQNVRIKQTIDTIPGEEYTLTWDYSARPNTQRPDSKMIVRVNGVKIATNNENGGTNTQWRSKSYTFTADSDTTTIMFVGKGSSNSLGALLDNTALMCVPAELEPEIEYGPYCGDGVINQDWEQNEVGDDGYNGTCQQEEQNQCSELKLVKITLDDSDSISFNDTVYLGNATNPIPSGVWFNFDELGDDTVNNIATSDNGLAVSRDVTGGRLLLGFRGDNDRREIDQARGTIETMGINLGSVDRNPIVSWPLEDGTGGSFNDVFDVNMADDTVNFDLRADTGRDAVAVDINAGEPYYCPMLKPDVFLDGYKWNDADGDGIWGEDEVGIPGWTITATNGDDVIEVVTDDAGYYSMVVPAGDWSVTEKDQEGWTQTYAGACSEAYPQVDAQYFISSESEEDNAYCFGNQEQAEVEEVIDDQSERHTGTRFPRSGPTGRVLGVSTTAGESCGLYLFDYMKMGMSNNPVEVYKLQAFLIGQGYIGISMTGVFDSATDRAVRAFQEKYRSDVLMPWYADGITSTITPTGYVYKTTKWKINDIMCPGIAPFPNLSENEV